MKLIYRLIISCFLLISVAASAHTGIQSSSPENGVTLKQSPTVIELNFKSAVRLMQLEMKAAGDELVNLALPASIEPTKYFSIPLPDLKKSIYKVNWVAAGADGHKIKGKFGFKYAGVNASANNDTVMNAEGSDNSISGWVVGIVLTKLLIYIALAMTVGGLTDLLTMTSNSSRRISYINQLPLGSFLGLLAVSLGFFLQVGSFAEDGISGMWNTDYLGILWDSGVGQSYRIQLIGWFLIIFTMMLTLSKLAYNHLFAVFGMVGIVLVAASFTLSGHTAETPIWVRAALTLHIIAAMWWVGSLYPLRSACDSLSTSSLQLLMTNFGKQAIFLVGLLVAAGGVISYHLEGSFNSLLDTGHGNLLLLKLGTVAFILFIAATHKFRLVPNLNNRASANALKRSITKEMWIAYLILLITAVMSTVTGPAFA